MDLNAKRIALIVAALTFIGSLFFVQRMEIVRREIEGGLRAPIISVPASSKRCVDCHQQANPGVVAHWRGSAHAVAGVACQDCHQADREDADSFEHYGARIATIVTPRDCARCHPQVAAEFERSHHAAGGNILASLDNFLAETVEGSRVNFDPHSPEGRARGGSVNGMAAALSGCQQCHGSKIALRTTSGRPVTFEDLEPDAEGKPTNLDAVARILRDDNGRPLFDPGSWPNTGIGRLNLDGSRGSCSACHSRHDFSPRRARQPENCGKCHLGPDHPQKEIYEESKHGVAYRDLRDSMNLDGDSWVLGRDYAHAPTCATCHMSGHSRNDGKITHDPRERISWTNRPELSLPLDTDINGQIVTELDPDKRRRLVTDTAQEKRNRMKQVCAHCHTDEHTNAFYKQYDDLVILYNEKFAAPGRTVMDALLAHGLITPVPFDDEIEWTWFYLWHHEGRRARMGASMMAPDYTQWHGMYEVAERFYVELIPQARELAEHAAAHGRADAAAAISGLLDEILARPEHAWFEPNRSARSAPGSEPSAGEP